MNTATLDLITSWGMAGIAALLIVWDVVIGAAGAKTESQILAEVARNWSILPLAFGVLIGHWLWQSKVVPGYTLWRYGLIVAGAVLALDLLVNLAHLKVPEWLRYPGLWAAAGVPLGALLWGQRMP